jgi:cytochrome c
MELFLQGADRNRQAGDAACHALSEGASMKLTTISSFAVAAGLLFGVVQGAQASEALARSKNCLSCHTVDKRVVGPSYKDIAARYKGKSAEAALVQKIRQGGSGSFGAVPMPPNPNVSEADARTLAKWILSF